jgi:hypothetical protein
VNRYQFLCTPYVCKGAKVACAMRNFVRLRPVAGGSQAQFLVEPIVVVAPDYPPWLMGSTSALFGGARGGRAAA